MRWFPAAILAATLCCGVALAAQRPATAPATQPMAGQIAAAIEQLGDDNFEVRERASKVLWSMGRAAEPLLRQAAGSSDPEVATRARQILDSFRYGIGPDTPPELRALAQEYAGADVQRKQQIVAQILRNDRQGIGLIVKLMGGENDPAARQQIFDQLAARSHPAAVACIAMGDYITAQSLLNQAVFPRGPHAGLRADAAADYGAFLLQRGLLDDQIAAIRKMPDALHTGVLAELLRLKGDLAGAQAVAGQNEAILETLAWDRGDWKYLADLHAPRASQSLNDVTVWAALEHRAGRSKEEAAALDLVRKHADANRDEGWYCAKALLMLDQTDDGIAMLRACDRREAAMELLLAQLRPYEALKIVKEAEADHDKMLSRLQLLAARDLYRLGEREKAEELYDAVAKNGADSREQWEWAALAETALAMGRRDVAAGFLASALAAAKPDANNGFLFDAFFPKHSGEADLWFGILKGQLPNEPPDKLLERIGPILNGKAQPADLEAWTAAAEKAALALPPQRAHYRDQALRYVVDALLAAKCEEKALAMWNKLADTSATPQPLIDLGDYFAQKKEWEKAGVYFERAWSRDRTNASAAWLCGWAMTAGGQAGDDKAREAQGLMSMGMLLPLGDESARHMLADTMDKHGAAEAARQQRTLILRTSHWESWYANDARRKLAAEAKSKGNIKTAADLLERTLLPIFRTNSSFVETTAYLRVPAEIHHLRAEAALAAGKTEDALAEMDKCMAYLPGHTDVTIEFVERLTAAGHKAEADAVFAKALAVHEKLTAAYPKAAQLHNGAAWLAAKCHRDLDNALTHAKTACELAPKNPAILDTLAEVHFARGEKDKAIEIIRQALAIEPQSAYLQEQLHRFEAGK